MAYQATVPNRSFWRKWLSPLMAPAIAVLVVGVLLWHVAHVSAAFHSSDGVAAPALQTQLRRAILMTAVGSIGAIVGLGAQMILARRRHDEPNSSEDENSRLGDTDGQN